MSNSKIPRAIRLTTAARATSQRAASASENLTSPGDNAALNNAHHKATRLRKLLEKHGVKLSRAEQLEAIAFIEGMPSWHVMAANLKAAHAAQSTPAKPKDAFELKWQVTSVVLDQSTGFSELHPDSNKSLTPAQLEQVRNAIPVVDDVLQESMRLAFVDGLLGVVVEQEFWSVETDGEETTTETTQECLTRLDKSLLPLVAPIVSKIPRARVGLISDETLSWHGRPSCWVFVPLESATDELLTKVSDVLQDYAY